MWDAFLIKKWIPNYVSKFDFLSQNLLTCTNVTKCKKGGKGLELLPSN
jgi:hypothetical protein